MEAAAYQAAQNAADQVAADVREDPHHREVMAAHSGQPTIAEQDRTHGAGLPPVDHGAR
jgi:hypothetical protein